MRQWSMVICTAGGLLLAGAAPAAAQWYASPFVGKLSNITFDQPAASDATAVGVAAGTSPRGRIGLELEFMHAPGVFDSDGGEFTDEDFPEPVVSSRLQTITASIQAGPAFTAGRLALRPYGVVGGGLGLYSRTVLDQDFEAFDTLPPSQQLQIFDCLFEAPPPTNGSELIALWDQCGNPYGEQKESAAAAMLNVGGGVMVFFSSHVGVRADFRYVTQIVPTEEKLKYFRSVVAVVIH